MTEQSGDQQGMRDLAYDTKVNSTTNTTTTHHNTMHVDYIDWDNYLFDDPKHTHCMCCNEDGKAARIQRQKEYLKVCEQHKDKDVYASDYGGWPRIWKKVISVGMASIWPYWEPRPTVLVSGTLGMEYIDWMSLTGAKIE